MLHLTSHGVLARAHRAIENNPVARTAAITSVSAAVGLAAGRSPMVRKVPAPAVAGAGLVLSYMGMSGVGDGLVGAGMTVLGYRFGATGKLLKKKAPALAPVGTPAPVAVHPAAAAGHRRRRG